MNTTDDNTANKEECTSCEQSNNLDNITEGIDSVVLNNVMFACASCGKEGNSEDMNTCNKCKSVKYCNAACKKKHRTKHKKACERRAAELHDKQLFKEPPPREECPICMLPLPINGNQSMFKSCCGKSTCDGCVHAMMISEGKDICAFCRTPDATSDEEHIKRLNKLMDNGNGEAYSTLASFYFDGGFSLKQDYQKARELYQKAGELGCATAYYNLGISYGEGFGVEIDLKKANHYFELSAIGGHIKARHNLGCLEGKACNYRRAMKHFMISARGGCKEALEGVKRGFMKEVVTKNEYANTLRAYHERQKEMKSEERDMASLLRIL